MKRKGITAFVLMIMLFLAGACAQKQDEQPGYAYKVYYINSDETAIFPVSTVPGRKTRRLF